jgi:hypothetical protein
MKPPPPATLAATLADRIATKLEIPAALAMTWTIPVPPFTRALRRIPAQETKTP